MQETFVTVLQQTPNPNETVRLAILSCWHVTKARDFLCTAKIWVIVQLILEQIEMLAPINALRLSSLCNTASATNDVRTGGTGA